jgi:hypothetical protein
MFNIYVFSGRCVDFLMKALKLYFFSRGVRLSTLDTSDTIWHIVPAPDDRWWLWSSQWNANWQGKPKYSEKTCSSATLSITNPTWPGLGSNPGRRSWKPATNRLSYGTALLVLQYWKIGLSLHVQECNSIRTVLWWTRFTNFRLTSSFRYRVDS